jgi:hypothetical protein
MWEIDHKEAGIFGLPILGPVFFPLPLFAVFICVKVRQQYVKPSTPAPNCEHLRFWAKVKLAVGGKSPGGQYASAPIYN